MNEDRRSKGGTLKDAAKQAFQGGDRTTTTNNEYNANPTSTAHDTTGTYAPGAPQTLNHPTFAADTNQYPNTQYTQPGATTGATTATGAGTGTGRGADVTADDASCGKAAGRGVRGVFSGIHGAGEAIRGNVLSAIDEAVGHNQGAARNENIARAGEQEMASGKYARSRPKEAAQY